jgi:hypothetical protein
LTTKNGLTENQLTHCICFGSGGWIRTNDLRVMRTKEVIYLFVDIAINTLIY